MKKQNKLTLIALFALSISLFENRVDAQENQLHIKAGRTFSNFMFRDSEKAKDETLSPINRTMLAASYDIALARLHAVRVEFGFREMGARSEINSKKLEWNLNYLDLNAAYNFNIYRNDQFTVYQGVGPYLAMLISGDQQLGDNYFDIGKNKSLKSIDFGANFFAGSKFHLADNVALSLEYRYGLGLSQIEANTDEVNLANSSQITRNRYHGVIIGLAFNFNYKTAPRAE